MNKIIPGNPKTGSVVYVVPKPANDNYKCCGSIWNCVYTMPCAIKEGFNALS